MIIPDGDTLVSLSEFRYLAIGDTLASEEVQTSLRLLMDSSTDSDSKLRAIKLIMMLLPDHPIWADFARLLCNESISRQHSLSLRFHTNSSALWRFRNELFRHGHMTEVSEIEFVSGLSGFKPFNYHLYDYWSGIVSPERLIDVHIPHLRRFILSNPSNFSPYNVILVAIRKSDNQGGLAEAALGALDLPNSVMSQSESFSDFLISLSLLLQDIPSVFLDDYFNRFKVHSSEYLGD